MLLPLPCSALLCFVYLVLGEAITKGPDGPSSMTLKLSLPVSFLEVWNNCKIDESEILKRSASQQGMLKKATRLELPKAEEKKITSFHVVCGFNNPLKLLVGDWAWDNISHSLAILFICSLFNLCMHKQQREGFYKITGKETVGSNGWGENKTEWEGWKE